MYKVEWWLLYTGEHVSVTFRKQGQRLWYKNRSINQSPSYLGGGGLEINTSRTLLAEFRNNNGWMDIKEILLEHPSWSVDSFKHKSECIQDTLRTHSRSHETTFREWKTTYSCDVFWNKSSESPVWFTVMQKKKKKTCLGSLTCFEMQITGTRVCFKWLNE